MLRRFSFRVETDPQQSAPRETVASKPPKAIAAGTTTQSKTDGQTLSWPSEIMQPAGETWMVCLGHLPRRSPGPFSHPGPKKPAMDKQATQRTQAKDKNSKNLTF